MNLIQKIRSDNNKTQEEMAKALNIPYRTYRHYELGDRSIPTEIKIKILELSIDKTIKKYSKTLKQIEELFNREY